jgi:hypothetical protein
MIALLIAFCATSFWTIAAFGLVVEHWPSDRAPTTIPLLR